MNAWRVICLFLLGTTILSGCVQQEEAVTERPIGATPPSDALTIIPPANMQAEATGTMTVVDLGLASATGGDGAYIFNNDAPATGFPMGTAMVNWTVVDGTGAQDTGTQSVTVSDTAAPTITLPPDIQTTATGEFTIVGISLATAEDLVDPFPTVTNNSPPNGFPVGTTGVTWTATDASGNVSTDMQMVTVTMPPDPGQLTLTPPGAITMEASGPTTTVALGAAIASGGTPPMTITNDAPAGGFPVGATTVTWTAVDANMASATGTQVVTITDTTAPSITAPADVAADQDAGGGDTIVNLGTPAFSDLVDPGPLVSNDAPANGFPVGTTTVVWTATDASGNSASDTQLVTINDPSFTVTPPAAVTMEATGPTTTVSLGNATANGGVDPVTISNDAPSGGFPVGETTVAWTATDANMATAIAMQTVTITDTTAPAITAPADASADQGAGGGNTTVNLGTPTVSDIVDPNPTVSNDAPANGFPVGNTTVTWMATDASGNSATATQLVSISGSGAEQCSALLSDWVGSVFPMMDTVTTCGGACHVTATPLPTASGWGFPDSATDEENFEVFRTVSRIDAQGESIVTAKARGFVQHGGGAVLQEGTANYTLLSDFVARARACEEAAPPPSGEAQVIRGSGYEQLNKLTVAIASRPPTSDEANAVAAAGTDQAAIENVLAGVLNGLMNEEEFYVRIAEIYNDILLTNKHANSTGRPEQNFEGLIYFTNADYFTSRNDTAQRGANYGIAHAPLALIRYVIENDRPFSEIVTADYTMVNPYSAVIYGVNPGGANYPFSSDNNPANHSYDDWRRVDSLTQTEGDRATISTAGVISTHAFLERYPSSNTNVNRHRSRTVFDYFLGLDIESLAPRDGLDLSAVIGDVPTYEDPQCTACHDVMDPVAGLFTKRLFSGRYRASYPYRHTLRTNGVPRMVPAGYGDTRNNPAVELPAGQEFSPLDWLGDQIAADDRFAQKTVRVVFNAFTGNESVSPDVTAFVDTTKNAFVASGLNFKTLIRDVLLSDYFLAQNLAPSENPNNYDSIGAGRLLTPEELDRRITAVTGGSYEWRGPNSNSGLRGGHYLLYGGIDSDEITTRATSPTSFFPGVQRRIANQVSCERVADDLYNAGTLFPLVDETITPDNGGEAAIRENLQFLHRHLLGEDLASDGPEIDASYQLFLNVRALGDTAIPTQCRGGGGASDSNGTVLPWMAVVNYLLSDYRFLYN